MTPEGPDLYKWDGKQRQRLHSRPHTHTHNHTHTHTHTLLQLLAMIYCDKREDRGLGSLRYIFTKMMVFFCPVICVGTEASLCVCVCVCVCV